MKGIKNRGLYIHIPFCRHKCSYCDFYSLTGGTEELLELYTECLIREINLTGANADHTNIETIYLGGGTPTLLKGKQLAAVLAEAYKAFSVADDAEVSIEANPATLNEFEMATMLESGVNRISLGVQSFDDSELKTLNRIHDSRDVYNTIELFHRKGIKNFNIDLIYGLPGQTLDKWLNNLKQALECNPAHISMYLLQLDPKTPMAREITAGRLKMPGEETEYLMYEKGCEYLKEQGFEHYEISNFSQTDFNCKHNLIYWQAREYWGIGAGAVGFIAARRSVNPHIPDYIKSLQSNKLPVRKELENMNREELLADAVILGLRLCKGISLQEYQQRFAVDIREKYDKVISEYIDKRLLNLENGYLSLTKKGYFLSNEVLCQFIA